MCVCVCVCLRGVCFHVLLTSGIEVCVCVCVCVCVFTWCVLSCVADVWNRTRPYTVGSDHFALGPHAAHLPYSTLTTVEVILLSYSLFSIFKKPFIFYGCIRSCSTRGLPLSVWGLSLRCVGCSPRSPGHTGPVAWGTLQAL